MSSAARIFRYKERAQKAIQEAKARWDHVDDLIAALEWGISHQPEIGPLLNQDGIVGFVGLRGVVIPGARSINEPDIDVLYEIEDSVIIILDLTFREAKAQYIGHA